MDIQPVTDSFDLDSAVNSPEFHAAIRKRGQSRVAQDAGCKPQYLSDWLCGRVKTSLEFRLRVAHALGWVILVRAAPRRKNRRRRRVAPVVALPPSTREA